MSSLFVCFFPAEQSTSFEVNADGRPSIGPSLATKTRAKIRSYSPGTVSPIEFAADTRDADLFTLLVQDLEARKGKLGDAKFNSIWETAKFDTPVSENPSKTLTRSEYFNGIESTVPNINNSYCFSPDGLEHARSDPLRWKSILLVSAIRDNQLSSAQMLAQSGVDIILYGALHIAAHRKDPRYMRCLLQNGADATATDRRGRTALHIAILDGFVETMTALIHGGSNVNQYMPSYRSATYARSSKGKLSLDSLFSHPPVGAPPLILAGSNVQMVGILLSNGADPRMGDDSEGTALSRAFTSGDIRLIKILLGFGAPIDTAGPYGQAPLHSLTRCDDTQCKMEDLKEAVLLFITAGKMLSRPRDFLNEKMHSSSLPGSSEIVGDYNPTPLSMSLIEGRWKLLHVFQSLGAFSLPTLI
ncbi:hypothetical protein DTO217A2_4754 [Paecilomyces variotii]|nr:hypothetical protein DTO217A2_4754 [Paecilomyces variotii]